jgi:hypothetical protein
MDSKTQEFVAVTASQAASALSKTRWLNAKPGEKQRMADCMERGRRRIPKAKRKELASNAARSISPEAAKKRANKAWKTRRKRLSEKNNRAA